MADDIQAQVDGNLVTYRTNAKGMVTGVSCAELQGADGKDLYLSLDAPLYPPDVPGAIQTKLAEARKGVQAPVQHVGEDDHAGAPGKGPGWGVHPPVDVDGPQPGPDGELKGYEHVNA